MSTLANRAGPFTHTVNSVSRTMLWVILALVPGTFYGLWLYGWPAVMLFVITLVSALAAEAAMLLLLGQPVRSRLWDGSALLTGWLLAMIVVNCLILGRAETFASKNSVALSALDGLAMGLGFTLALTLMGALREIGGSGTVFSGAANLLGPALGVLETRVYPGDGALVMILPAGGFIVLGLMIAAKRALDARKPAARPQAASAETRAPVAAAS